MDAFRSCRDLVCKDDTTDLALIRSSIQAVVIRRGVEALAAETQRGAPIGLEPPGKIRLFGLLRPPPPANPWSALRLDLPMDFLRSALYSCSLAIRGLDHAPVRRTF